MKVQFKKRKYFLRLLPPLCQWQLLGSSGGGPHGWSESADNYSKGLMQIPAVRSCLMILSWFPNETAVCQTSWKRPHARQRVFQGQWYWRRVSAGFWALHGLPAGWFAACLRLVNLSGCGCCRLDQSPGPGCGWCWHCIALQNSLGRKVS